MSDWGMSTGWEVGPGLVVPFWVNDRRGQPPKAARPTPFHVVHLVNVHREQPPRARGGHSARDRDNWSAPSLRESSHGIEIPSWVGDRKGRSSTPSGPIISRSTDQLVGHIEIEPRGQTTEATVVRTFDTRAGEKDKLRDKTLRAKGISLDLDHASLYRPESDHAGWRSSVRSLRAWGFLSAKAGSDSEDAEPLFAVVESGTTARAIAGVFDGMGGAGASTSAGSENTFTEAYRASRIARRTFLLQCLPSLVDAFRFGRAESFRTVDVVEALTKELQSRASTMAPASSRIRGTLTKSFPTTLACAEVRITTRQSTSLVDVRAIWAGDSRVWVLTPDSGLQQLSRDDVSINDPLEQLRQDPPMNNVVSASVAFTLREHTTTLTGPCLVICATDGVCGYVNSPGEVELLMLRALSKSISGREPFERMLFNEFGSVAKDDASAVLVAVGFRNEDDLNARFSERLQRLEERYSVLDRAMSAEERSAVIDAVWNAEAHLYSARMPGGGGANG